MNQFPTTYKGVSTRPPKARNVPSPVDSWGVLQWLMVWTVHMASSYQPHTSAEAWTSQRLPIPTHLKFSWHWLLFLSSLPVLSSSNRKSCEASFVAGSSQMEEAGKNRSGEKDVVQPKKAAQPTSPAMAYGCMLLWIFMSACVILFNKYLLAYADFGFPIALTTIHMGFCSAVCIGLVKLGVLEVAPIPSELYWRWGKSVSWRGMGFMNSMVLSTGSSRRLSGIPYYYYSEEYGWNLLLRCSWPEARMCFEFLRVLLIWAVRSSLSEACLLSF